MAENLQSRGASIGQAVRKHRLGRRWSRGQLAERAGVDRSYVGRLEEGVYDNPGTEPLGKIATAFGISPADLLPDSRSADEQVDVIREQVLAILAAEPEITVTIAETGRAWTEADRALILSALESIKEKQRNASGEIKFG